MRNEIAKNLLFYPVHYLRGEYVAPLVREVQEINAASSERIALHQEEALCRVIDRALSLELSLYRDLRRHRKQVRPAEVLQLLQEMPLVSKEAMRAAVKEDRRKKGRGLDYRSTSGSTGMPFQFYKDRLATGYMDSVQYAANAWYGIDMGDPQARFWGMPLGAKGALVARVKDLLRNRIRFSAFDLSLEAKEAFYARLRGFAPSYFYGYPSLIAEFCRYAAQQGVDLSALPLKAVVGTGEYVYPRERELISAATGAPFVSEYGCTEVGLIGFECRHGSMHLMASNIVLEIIKDGKSVIDEEGDVYVTELHASHFPFIRYGLGDRGKIVGKPCSCGRNLPVFEVISGRKDDYVITPEGGKIYDAIFAYVLKKGVDQFKAVQTAADRVEITLVANAEYSEELERRYLQELSNRISPCMQIAISRVDRIERSKSGKLRYFERKIN
ncbi:adenylyltransferase, putative [Citrifermentans bemidjiense Bem]|uniref:Adenylyltransferase, putative n=1 Tax=Citrifermentans bemidjiense (strain ATCC BAA-1014 / DSM 16622 / JCM 12645 / Bem) TaxID=404380 RepID=B5EAA3_CITBB|nr:phenylacetate--CoA ligase family protein [Citrifermentans bemidjiense]ACH38809.1 adenylyltransferase, putative [Citrifermentans bemidjiense Bem]